MYAARLEALRLAIKSVEYDAVPFTADQVVVAAEKFHNFLTNKETQK